MRKKRRSKPKPKPRLKLGTKSYKGKNAKSITFAKSKKDVDKVYQSLDTFDYSTFNYLRRKNKPDGHHYKPPRGFVVIITISKGKSELHFTRVSPPDMVVNNANIKLFVKQCVQEMEENWESAKDAIEEGEEGEVDGMPLDYVENLDPAKIIEIQIKFFY